MPWGWTRSRRYHRETPGLFVPQQLFTATDAIGFPCGGAWNLVRRNIFNWKLDEPQRAQRTQSEEDSGSKSFAVSAFSAVNEFPGRLEQKVKSFCAIPQVLAFLKDYIVFAEKDEEMIDGNELEDQMRRDLAAFPTTASAGKA